MSNCTILNYDENSEKSTTRKIISSECSWLQQMETFPWWHAILRRWKSVSIIRQSTPIEFVDSTIAMHTSSELGNSSLSNRGKIKPVWLGQLIMHVWGNSCHRGRSLEIPSSHVNRFLQLLVPIIHWKFSWRVSGLVKYLVICRKTWDHRYYS